MFNKLGSGGALCASTRGHTRSAPEWLQLPVRADVSPCRRQGWGRQRRRHTCSCGCANTYGCARQCPRRKQRRHTRRKDIEGRGKGTGHGVADANSPRGVRSALAAKDASGEKRRSALSCNRRCTSLSFVPFGKGQSEPAAEKA